MRCYIYIIKYYKDIYLYIYIFFLGSFTPKNAGHINMHFKNLSRFAADLPLGGKVTIPVPLTDLKSKQLSFIFNSIP